MATVPTAVKRVQRAIRWLEYLCLFTLIFSLPVSAQQEVGTEVAILMSQLRDKNDSVRRAAESLLWQMNKDSLTESLPILIEALGDKDKFVRRIAASVIGNINQDAAMKALPALRDALTDTDVFVRSSAAGSLGIIGRAAAPEAVRALTRALDDKNLLVRVSAAEALGEIGPPAVAAIAFLTKATQAQDRLLRSSAVTALGKIGRGAGAPEAINVLKLALKDEDIFVRFSAAEAIGQIGPQAGDAVPDLRKAAEDKERTVRRAAVNALGKIAQAGINEARVAIEESLQSRHADVRLVAVETFWRFGLLVKNAVVQLQQALRDSEADIRRAAARALGRVRPVDPQVITALEDTLRDKNALVREAAASALGRIGAEAKEALTQLEQALKDPYPEVRRAAAIALGNIRPTTSEVIAALKTALDDQTDSVRQAGVWALVSLGSTPPDAVPTLIKMLQDPEPEIRRGAAVILGRMGLAAKAAVLSLSKLLRDPHEQVRLDATVAIGAIGTAATEAVPALTEVLIDAREKQNVRQAAAESLGKIGTVAKHAMSALRDTMRDENEQLSFAAARSLVHVTSPEESVRVLIVDLNSSDISLRRAAVNALITMGPAAKDAVPTLIDAVRGQNEDISRMAVAALGRMGLAAKNGIDTLTDALNKPKPHGVAAEALANIALALQDAGATDMINPLEKAYGKISALKEPALQRQADILRRAIDDLKRQRMIDFRQKLLDWLATHLVLISVPSFYVVLLIICFLIFWLRPLWLMDMNYALPRYTDFELNVASYGRIKVPLRHVLVIGFFQHRLRILDKWIERYISVARDEFANKSTVRDRRVHIPLPVKLDHQSVNLMVEHLRPTFKKGRGCLLIWGEGGGGKTSLACQIAKWASEDPGNCLCQHLMIPVLIEEQLDREPLTDKNALTETIRGQLGALLRLQDPIPEDFLLELLKRQRVLVIIDHLSEMNEATRSLIRPSQPVINALVVTSRREERLDGVPRTVVQPLRVEGERGVLRFMMDYLSSTGKQDLFTDEELVTNRARLLSIVHDRPITPLLAKMFVEQMIAISDGRMDYEVPNNIPQLMLYYLNNINRFPAIKELDDRTVQHVSKIIAWECLKETYRPVAATRESILKSLVHEKQVEELLAYLEDRLRLINISGPEKNQIRFGLDPLAEYLAALYIVDSYGNARDFWQEFLIKADSVPEQSREFLFAVRDCCLARPMNEEVRCYAVTEIERRLRLAH